MAQFVIEDEEDAEPRVSVEIEANSGEVNLYLDGYTVAILRKDGLELVHVAGLTDDIDSLCDKDGYLKVRREGATRLLK